MKIITAEQLAQIASYDQVIAAVRTGFCDTIHMPQRLHFATSPASNLLLMPAWSKAWTGLKTVVVKADNAAQNLPTVQASYLLIDNHTGRTVAMLDGTELTRRRTAAAAALAADYLARRDANTLLLVGAGALALHFIQAHATVRPIRNVLIYNRSPAKAEAVRDSATALGFAATVGTDLPTAVAEADIISCITTATAPIIQGAWVKPGTHIDLAGAYTPDMRETDGALIGQSQVFVDTREGAQAEAGDLIQAAREGHFSFANVKADLFELCAGTRPGRTAHDDITLFKSSGAALEDLATAVMIYEQSLAQE